MHMQKGSPTALGPAQKTKEAETDIKTHIYRGKFNLFAYSMLTLENNGLCKELIDKIERITREISALYLKNRPYLDPDSPKYDKPMREKFNGGLYGLNETSYMQMQPLKTPAFFMTEDEFRFRNNLIQTALTEDDTEALVRINYRTYSELPLASIPTLLRMDCKKGEEPGLSNLHNSNDYTGIKVYDYYRERFKRGDAVKILELGGGTGGTVEAIVWRVFDLAKKDGIDPKSIRLEIQSIEISDHQLAAMQKKIDLLLNWVEKIGGERRNISIVPYQQDFVSCLNIMKKLAPNQRFHAVVANYSLHHVLDSTKKELSKTIYKGFLVDGGLLIANDCDGLSKSPNMDFFNFSPYSFAAPFDSPGERRKMLEAAGFSAVNPIQDEAERRLIANCLGEAKLNQIAEQDAGHVGFLLSALKPALSETIPEFSTKERLISEQQAKAITRLYRSIREYTGEFFGSNPFWKHVSTKFRGNLTGSCEEINTLFSDGVLIIGNRAEQQYLIQTAQLPLEEMLVGFKGKKGVWDISLSARSDGKLFGDTRHLPVFEMIEPEGPNLSLEKIMDIQEKLLHHVITRTLKENRDDLEMLGANIDYLEYVRDKFQKFNKVTYTEAIGILQKEGFDVKIGDDLKSAHERALLKHFKNLPTFVTIYPTNLKFFNMFRREDGFVNSVDLLLPPFGESSGGAEREYAPELIRRNLVNSQMYKDIMREGLSMEAFESYIKIWEEYGLLPRGGFGMGIARVMGFLTGVDDIRFCTPYVAIPDSRAAHRFSILPLTFAIKLPGYPDITDLSQIEKQA